MSDAPNLEQLRKRAKDLRKAHASGDAAALARVRAVLPTRDAAPLRLAQAQLVVAREAGYASWPRLAHALKGSVSTADELVRAAVAGWNRRVAELLAARATPNPVASLALATHRDPDLSAFAADVNARVGVLDWPPLLYVCCSMYANDDAAIRSNRVTLAQQLLALGSDPNVGTAENESVRGYRTALGGAVGKARNAALARVLLNAGADVSDGPTLYEGSALWVAVRHSDVECIRALVEAEPPVWQLCHALPHCLDMHDADVVRLLLDAGANPNWTKGALGFGGSCLHEALMARCGVEIVALLLERGAQVDFEDRDGSQPLSLAVRLGNEPVARLLRERGADASVVSAVDAWVAACWRARDADAAPEAPPASDFRPSDHLWLVRAVRERRAAAAVALLRGGVNSNARDDDGWMALHHAAACGNSTLCATLLAAGADANAENFEGRSALELAGALRAGSTRDETLEVLVRHGANAGAGALDAAERAARDGVFETCADAVVAGDIETLRTALVEYPWLVRARSSRPHHATLLHYLGANGVEGERQRTPSNAVDVADMLLRAGAEPNATCCTYRGGPDETALGLMLSSDHPRRAGLTMALAAVFVRHGASVADPERAVVELDAARAEGRLLGAVAALTPERAGPALVRATAMNEAALVAAMLDAGVSPDARHAGDVTALHEAAVNGFEAIVDALLEAGADPNLRDATYRGTPAGWADAGGHAHLSERLRELESQ